MAKAKMRVKFLTNDIPKMRFKVNSVVQDLALETAEDVKSDVIASLKSGGPSSPGQPPAVVSGELAGSFHVAPGKKSSAVVYSDDWKSLHLELGTQKMARRPYMEPALNKNLMPFLRKLASLEKRLK